MRVFVSYSHDSPEHMDRVLGLCNRLRADGVDCVVDQYEVSPAQGWPRWTEAQVEEARYILLVCTEVYGRRFKGKEQAGEGLGVKWEGAVITQNLYDAEADNDKFIPVLFAPQDAAHVPTVLRGATRYDLTAPGGYTRLYRRLTNQPEVSKPPLGEFKPLPPLERKQEFIPLSVGGDAGRGGAAGGKPVEKSATRTPPNKTALLLLVLPTALIATAVLVLLNWHLPTHVRAELTVRRVVFTVGGADKSAVINSLGLKSLFIEKFSLVKFKPESLTLSSASPRKPAARTATAPRPTSSPQPVVVRPKDERFQSSVSFSAGANGQPYPLAMGDVLASPSSEVTLETTEDAYDLIMRVDGQHSSGNITAAGQIKVGIDNCEVSGVADYPAGEQSLNLEAKLARDSSVEFDGQPDSLVLTMTVPPDRAAGLFPRGSIPVKAIRFEQQSEQGGAIVSSLLKEGALSNPDFEKVGMKKIAPTDFVSLDGLDKFSIEEVRLDPEAKGIALTLQGVADKVTTGTPDFKVDQRLTAYDVVSNNHQVLVLFSICCWVFGTSVGAYKLYKGGDK
jgi:hypothetical protein